MLKTLPRKEQERRKAKEMFMLGIGEKIKEPIIFAEPCGVIPISRFDLRPRAQSGVCGEVVVFVADVASYHLPGEQLRCLT